MKLDRNMFWMNSVLLIFATLLTVNAFAADPESLFAQLKDSGVSYEVAGTICEQAARIELSKQYRAPQYQVLNDIRYDDRARTIGELDEVVIEASTGKAVLIAEVKCWKNLNSGLSKALDQRSRFLNTMKNPAGITLFSNYLKRSMDIRMMAQVKDFITIAQAGAKQYGFDMELPYSLEQLMHVREEIIECQHKGLCH